jgi:hypothetical protein
MSSEQLRAAALKAWDTRRKRKAEQAGDTLPE